MTHWDQFNHNIGYAGMYEDQPTSTDDSNGSETTQETSTSSDVAYTPITGSTTTPCVAKKKKILKERKERIENFFGYSFLLCALLAVILFISGVVASMLEARSVQINCILGFGAAIVFTFISGAIAFRG